MGLRTSRYGPVTTSRAAASNGTGVPSPRAIANAHRTPKALAATSSTAPAAGPPGSSTRGTPRSTSTPRSTAGSATSARNHTSTIHPRVLARWRRCGAGRATR
ncbi:hypothetical protein [Kineococcus sp. SYSU DK005]|uniref:hypothetical protein n=1 Tax=Kineococcus sp. SYSU DK005 TaxID=3383126 RepID=UPI003D7EFA4F